LLVQEYSSVKIVCPGNFRVKIVRSIGLKILFSGAFRDKIDSGLGSSSRGIIGLKLLE
jgi:hypothetical protein